MYNRYRVYFTDGYSLGVIATCEYDAETFAKSKYPGVEIDHTEYIGIDSI